MATFRKSKKIGGIRFTFSPSGVSGSAGPKGAKLSVNSKGDVHRTLSVPGTGAYDRKKIHSGKRSPGDPEPEAQPVEPDPEPTGHVGDIVTGYGVTASYDGQILHVEPTNRAARGALGADQVTLRREQIATVELKSAGMVTNGNLVLRTVDGRKVQLHFLRKHGAAFADLAARLTAQ